MDVQIREMPENEDKRNAGLAQQSDVATIRLHRGQQHTIDVGVAVKWRSRQGYDPSRRRLPIAVTHGLR
jgi:hypothetical protein